MVHIPCITIVYGTSNGLQNDIGNYLGPCSRFPAWFGGVSGRGVEVGLGFRAVLG